jgi:hypothetical protein
MDGLVIIGMLAVFAFGIYIGRRTRPQSKPATSGGGGYIPAEKPNDQENAQQTT